jgi:2-dehydro-3-deoxyglucarate aldolase
MNRLILVKKIRKVLREGNLSLGSWMQIPHSSIAEILGQAGYDWVAVDMEHGTIAVHQLPDIFRALELGNTLPLVRVAQGTVKDCKQALDAGAGGVIIPMIENAAQLKLVRDACCWPPTGTRGVGFSRANLFGKYFKAYIEEAQRPLLIAMIEHISAVDQLDEILQVDGLDGVLVGPYDLSASMKLTASFDEPLFKQTIEEILRLCKKAGVAAGIHIVNPDPMVLQDRVSHGYQFIAYSIDSVFLNQFSQNPLKR